MLCEFFENFLELCSIADTDLLDFMVCLAFWGEQLPNTVGLNMITIILLGSLLPFCLGGDAKSIVLTNQRTPIQNASPNSEREPKFGYASPHSDVRGCALSLPGCHSI